MLYQYYPTVLHPYPYELNKDFHFSAAHFIDTEEAGKCRNMHGHTYSVNLTIVGDELDESGFLVNFQDLKKLVHDRYDHTVLNNHVEFTGIYNQPSTEFVAHKIFEIVEAYLAEFDRTLHCVQVIVRETPTSYVIFRPTEDMLHG
jgi:6-pyruvoyltetrahydropterin/6-carboxytetrahydropterin synthase